MFDDFLVYCFLLVPGTRKLSVRFLEECASEGVRECQGRLGLTPSPKTMLARVATRGRAEAQPGPAASHLLRDWSQGAMAHDRGQGREGSWSWSWLWSWPRSRPPPRDFPRFPGDGAFSRSLAKRPSAGSRPPRNVQDSRISRRPRCEPCEACE